MTGRSRQSTLIVSSLRDDAGSRRYDNINERHYQFAASPGPFSSASSFPRGARRAITESRRLLLDSRRGEKLPALNCSFTAGGVIAHPGRRSGTEGVRGGGQSPCALCFIKVAGRGGERFFPFALFISRFSFRSPRLFISGPSPHLRLPDVPAL